MGRDLTPFVAAIKRIPLFRGLTPEQAMMLLKSCETLSVAVNQTVCKVGDQSEKMFILLSGKLSVYSPAGVRVAFIEPVAPVGEMGMFTGETRSATVKTSEPSTMFVLGKPHLDHLLRRNPGVELVISRNLIRTLSERLIAANQEITHLGKLLSDQEEGSAQPEADPEAS
jgi:CRP-like cAMP-binding protein